METNLSWIDILLSISYLGAFIITTICIFHALRNAKAKNIAFFCLLLFLFLISYAMSSDEILNPKAAAAYYCVPPMLGKQIGGGLITAYTLFTISCLSIIYIELKHILNNCESTNY